MNRILTHRVSFANVLQVQIDWIVFRLCALFFLSSFSHLFQLHAHFSVFSDFGIKLNKRRIKLTKEMKLNQDERNQIKGI